jgi:hypothetical protein
MKNLIPKGIKKDLLAIQNGAVFGFAATGWERKSSGECKTLGNWVIGDEKITNQRGIKISQWCFYNDQAAKYELSPPTKILLELESSK